MKKQPPEYLTKTQVAKRLGVCTKTVERYVRSGAIPAIKFARAVRFQRDAVDNALAALAANSRS